MRLIDANAHIEEICKDCGAGCGVDDGHCVLVDGLMKAPTVEAYTGEQLIHILNSLDKLEAENKELRMENVWLKSCLNCKIRKECPRHCGKVVHNCDHWEYGDNAVEVVHGRWEKHWCDNSMIGHEFEECSECGCSMLDTNQFWDSNYCPNCGAKMDL